MKNYIIILFLSLPFLCYSQKKSHKKLEINSNDIEISTEGIDNISIENSENKFLEVFLFDEFSNKHHILLEENKEKVSLKFKIDDLKTEETVFRKFITKRLNRAYVIVKAPKDKSITIFGENIDIESNNYKGNLSIYIDKGDLKLHTIQKNLLVKLYAGNISAIIKNTNIDVVSNLGKISIDNKEIKKTYKKEDSKHLNKFIVNSIKANILLTTKKTQ